MHPRRRTRGALQGRARRRAFERRAAAAGWQLPAEPTMPRLNSQVLGSEDSRSLQCPLELSPHS